MYAVAGKKNSAEYVPLSQKDENHVVFDVHDQESPQAYTTHPRLSGPLLMHRRIWPTRKRTFLILVLLAGIWGLASRWLAASTPIASRSKVAFVTLLSGEEGTHANSNGGRGSIDDDNYFVATRLLGYQVMHDPQTRTNLGAPFVVMTTPQVEPAKLDRLRKDGAIVWPIAEPLNSLNSTQSRHFSSDDINKLLVWKWTQFERIVFLDNHVILNRPLDTIFNEPQVAKLHSNLGKQSAVLHNEALQPSEYLFAPLPGRPSQTSGVKSPNTAFFVLKPDQAMWEYFVSLFAAPGKFHPTGQDFLRFVFRPEGNMPLTFLDPHWSLHRPASLQAAEKAMSIHHKWWTHASDASRQRFDLGLQFWMRSWRWKMEGYYQGLNDAATRRFF